METQKRRQWGVTSAISEAPPTDGDLKLNDQLVEALKARNNFESPEGLANRQKVLGHLQKITEEFIRRVCKIKGLPQSTIENAGGLVMTFGSYALGVSNPGSDIDTLIVGPKHVNVGDYFKYFPDIFREMSSVQDIGEFVPVPDAYVPLIKMQYRGVDVDLLYVCLASKASVTKDIDITDKNVLRGLDDNDMRNMNGIRNQAELMSLVPQIKSFRHALRAIKLWSTGRGIYGNVFGFPGGIAWAIMVARICQLYPFACGATILAKFFNLMKQWHWPRPVMLRHIEEGQNGFKVWNPQLYGTDKGHIMPIITPAFPSMCATHSIGPSQKAIMLEEFLRADGIVAAIHLGQKSWPDLFERHTFFTSDYKYYLSVVAACRTKEDMAIFSGLVQSKIRLLVRFMDDSDDGVDIARPYVDYFERCHRCDTEDEVDLIKKGNMKFEISKDQAKAFETNRAEAPDGSPEAEQHIIYTTTWYIGLKLPESGGRSLDISYPVAEFRRFITLAPIYNADNMSVQIVHTRNYDLPADVFEDGELRPMRPEKKNKKTGKATSKATKRGFAETGLDDSASKAKRRQSETANGITATPV